MADIDLYDLSDSELEAAFREAKAEEQSPETSVEDETEEDGINNEEEEFDDSDDDMEQPDEDSDDDTGVEDADDEESDEDSDEEEDTDEESETEDEQTEEETDEADDDTQPAQDEILTFRANGQEYNFTPAEMKEQFGKVFGQAMDYTKKMQQIKPWRKTLDAIEQAELGQEDVNLMIDVLKGDKDAIAAVLKRTGVDALDLDVDNSNYTTKDYGRNDTELNIRDIVDEIGNDKEYAVTSNVLEKRWDDKSRQSFVEDPNLIRLLHTDVKSGMFDKVSPIAEKLKVYDGGKQSDLDYYMSAAQQYFNSESEQKTRDSEQEQNRVAREAKATEAKKLSDVKAKQAKQRATKKDSVKRKAAAPTRKVAGTKNAGNLLDDSDEGFDEWYKQLQDAR